MIEQCLRTVAVVVLGTIATIWGSPARAVTHCVSSTAQLQSALTQSGSEASDDEIRVVAGTYVVTQSLFFTSTLAKSIRVSGGWAAGCTIEPANDARSVLSGNSTTSIFGSNVNTVVNFAFDRLTIVDGRRGAPGGAGFFLRTLGNVSVDRSEFLRNVTTVVPSRGGAIFIKFARDIFVDRTRFEDNDAGTGGAIYVSGCAGPARFERSSFLQNGNRPLNNGTFGGSAIYVANEIDEGVLRPCPSISVHDVSFVAHREAPLSLYATGPIELSGTSISGTIVSTSLNSDLLACGRLTSQGGGGDGEGKIDLVDSMFEGSNASGIGCLALNVGSFTNPPADSLTVLRAQFSNFSASVFSEFGLISNRCLIKDSRFEDNDSGPVMRPICRDLAIRDSRFANNESVGDQAAAVQLGFGTDTVLLESNVFFDNSSASGGGALQVNLFCVNANCGVNPSASVTLVNNTFASNVSGQNGGAVVIRSAFDETPSIYLGNNLFWSNMANGLGDDLYFDNDYDGDFVPTEATFEFNALALSGDGYASNLPVSPPQVPPNFDAVNPRFFSLATGDLRLTSPSPYLDVGLNTAPGLDADDVAGSIRLVGRIDLGAYELNGQLLPELIFRDGFETP